MDAVTDCLLKTRLLSGLSPGEIETVLPLLDIQQKSYAKGAMIVDIDGVIDYVGVVRSGGVSLYKEDAGGNSNLIGKVRPGRLFGIEVACTPTQVSPLVIACDTDAQILEIPFRVIGAPSRLPDCLRCQILKNILWLVANANMRQLYKIDILSKKSLRERILLYLSLIARRKKSSAIEIPFNREEFADYLCVDRSALSRELSRMQKEGLITFEKNRFVLLTDLKDKG